MDVDSVSLGAPVAAGAAAGLDANAAGVATSGDGGSNGKPARVASPGWSSRVELPNDGQMVGFVWDNKTAGAITMRSRNAQGWSEWVEVHGGEGEGPDAPEKTQRQGAGPVWVGPGTEEIEVKVTEGDLTNLRLDAIEIERQTTAGVAQAGAAPGWANIIPRTSWSAGPYRSDYDGCGSAPASAKPRYAVIHHTVTTNTYSAAQAYDLVLGIYQFHTGSQGWCDIGYNFVVDRFGQIFQGRTDSVLKGAVGSHVAGFNTGSIGVSLLGQHHPGASPAAAGVSAAATEAVKRLLIWKFAYHGIDANLHNEVVSQCSDNCRYSAGTRVKLPAIVTHRDLGLTSCPGDYAAGLAPALIPQVAEGVLKSGQIYGFGAWTPDRTKTALQTLDMYGGLHPAGGASAVNGSYWPWGPARGFDGTAEGGYVVDSWGGIHPYGNATPSYGASGYWPGWDIVRGIAVKPGTTAGYVLSGWGSIHPFGGAPAVTELSGYWPGWDIANAIALEADGQSGYVLSGWGSVHPFGGAPAVKELSGYWPGWDIARDIAVNPDGPGGWVLSGWGSIHPFGGAPPIGGRYTPGSDSARGLTMISDSGGYLVDASGGVWAVGDAPPVASSQTWIGFDVTQGIVSS